MKKSFLCGLAFSLLCLCGLTAACSRNPSLTEYAQQRNRVFTELLQREDRREFGEAAYWQALLNQIDDPQIWDRTLLALARIGDQKALPLLQKYAWHPNDAGSSQPSVYSHVRVGAAFAIGEIEDRDTRQSLGRVRADAPSLNLLIFMTGDPAMLVRARAAEALGKIDDARALPCVLALLPEPGAVLAPPELEAADLVITALFRLGDRKAINPLLALANHAEASIRWRVANAIYRLLLKTPGEPLAQLTVAMKARLADRDPTVRGYAARALSATQDRARAQDLLPLLADPDFFVQVEAVHGLGRLSSPEAVKPLIEKLNAWVEERSHPRRSSEPRMQNLAVAIVQALGAIGEAEALPLLHRLRFRLDPVSNAAEVAAARILKGRDAFFGDSIQHLFEMRGYWMRFNTLASLRAAISALGEHGSESALSILRDIMEQEKDEDRLIARTRPALLKAMAKLNAPDLETILLRHLTDPDEVTRRTAAEEIGKLVDRSAISGEVISALAHAYINPSLGSTPETQRQFIAALAKLADHPPAMDTLRQALRDPHLIVRTPALRQPLLWDDPHYAGALGPSKTHLEDTAYMLAAASRRNTTLAILESTRGKLEIELFPEEAPLTVLNFSQLARKGFYNGLSFMRVVPNFVVQTGDPRDDMEGGPGYTIRCEINRRSFLRGSVGMALSGKDTGGSQFFICLSPQPHLDGGYTVFGRVIAGMNIVDNLTPTDKILNVRIREIQARHFE